MQAKSKKRPAPWDYTPRLQKDGTVKMAVNKEKEPWFIDEPREAQAQAGPSKPGPRKKDNAVKRWCFTLNNPTDKEKELIKNSLTEDQVIFAVVGQEVGENGTPHLQGFVNWKSKCRLSFMKKIMPRAHFESAKGTDLQNDEYCMKEGNPYLRIGEPGSQGKRNDLQKAVQMLHDTNGNLSEVARACPTSFIRYGRGLRDYWLTVGAHPRDFKTDVTVLIGPPGCGKSKFCFENTEATPTFYKQRGEWWDGYMGQENVIIDDFYGWIKYDEMLRICDRYPVKVPVKGSYVEFSSKKIYITSNEHLMNWYKFDNFDPQALMRRVTSYKFWFNNAFIEMSDCTIEQCPIKMAYNY